MKKLKNFTMKELEAFGITKEDAVGVFVNTMLALKYEARMNETKIEEKEFNKRADDKMADLIMERNPNTDRESLFVNE